METKKQRKEKPLPLADGRDEMNLAEFPIALIAERVLEDQKTVEFSDWVTDPRERRAGAPAAGGLGVGRVRAADGEG